MHTNIQSLSCADISVIRNRCLLLIYSSDTADNREASPRFATGVTEDQLSQPLAFRLFLCPEINWRRQHVL